MTDPRTGSPWRLGDRFDQVYPHLGSINALWNQKWKSMCEKGSHPFIDGKLEDFVPIFETLIDKGINDGYSEEYTKEFLPTAEKLVGSADQLHKEGKNDEAIKIYLRACAVYRIGRYPYIPPSGGSKREAYERQKAAYMKAVSLFDCPIQDVNIPHTAGNEQEGPMVSLYVRMPHGASSSTPCPAIIFLCGMDGHRPDNTARSNEFLKRGWASVIADIPGTADCLADRRDPAAVDRLLTSILDWMERCGTYDMKKIVCWGVSAGGYFAIRVAHTHASRLAGAIGHGAATHHFFSRAWLEKAKGHEYPWSGVPAVAQLYGYENEDDLMNNGNSSFGYNIK